MTKIVFWSDWPSTPEGGIARHLPDDTVVTITREADLAQAGDAEVAFGGIRQDRVKTLLAATPKLRWYHTPAAGVDRLIDIPDFRERRFKDPPLLGRECQPTTLQLEHARNTSRKSFQQPGRSTK